MNVPHFFRALALLALPLTALAQAPVPPVETCSGSLEREAGNLYVLRCIGNLDVSTGSVVASTAIRLYATGSISLTHAALTAPIIELVGGTIALDSSSRLIAGTSIDLGSPIAGQAPNVVSSGAGTLSIGGAPVALTPIGSLSPIALNPQPPLPSSSQPISFAQQPASSDRETQEAVGAGSFSTSLLFGLVASVGLLVALSRSSR